MLYGVDVKYIQLQGQMHLFRAAGDAMAAWMAEPESVASG